MLPWCHVGWRRNYRVLMLKLNSWVSTFFVLVCVSYGYLWYGDLMFFLILCFSARKNIMLKNWKFYNGPWSTPASFSGLSTSLAFGWGAIWLKQLLLVDGTWQPLREIKLATIYLWFNFWATNVYTSTLKCNIFLLGVRFQRLNACVLRKGMVALQSCVLNVAGACTGLGQKYTFNNT